MEKLSRQRWSKKEKREKRARPMKLSRPKKETPGMHSAWVGRETRKRVKKATPSGN